MRPLRYILEDIATRKELAEDFYVTIVGNKSHMEDDWKDCLRHYANELMDFKNYTIKDLITMPFEDLIEIYNTYQEAKELWSNPKRSKNLEKKLQSIFNYQYLYPTIVNFISKGVCEGHFELSTCHYCETAYINKYTVDPHDEVLNMLNNMSVSSLKKEFKGFSSKDWASIINHRPYNVENDYNKLPINIQTKVRNLWRRININKVQFDIDHFLDKGSCPLIALSLFNFVPSCQICNSRLKHDKQLKDNNGKIVSKLSPTSDDFAFDNEVKIIVIPTSEFDYAKILNQDKGKFKLEFVNSTGVYQNFIDMFRLEDRYTQHIVEALRIIDLYHRYPRQYMEMMCKDIDGITPAILEEDLFAEKFTEQHHRTFAKLRRDTLELCRKETLDTSIIDVKS